MGKILVEAFKYVWMRFVSLVEVEWSFLKLLGRREGIWGSVHGRRTFLKTLVRKQNKKIAL